MEKQLIYLGDWRRILFGEAPAEFMIEVFFRSLIFYVILIVVMRFMGKRMSGQLTIMEMAVMITLGAIIAPPMQIPDKGMLQGLLVLLCAFIFQRGVNFWAVKSSKVESLLQGEVSVLIKDGRMQMEEMEKAKISKQQLYAVLRNKAIFNLAEVERVYLEACGLFSIYKYDKGDAAKPKAGLSLLPPADEGIQSLLVEIEEDVFVCNNCGNLATTTKTTCDRCGKDAWTKAKNS
ncbi:hypothetical protein GCM10027275_43280 [Rhabdobacter roseus]|uniref:Uncharacterized membrane protein YcaP (DUF421 family) n=1 Tax=Rhabdobacter roseus TaxID=1655419 RepID=A0A840TYI4_9BACT|nr:YetF domain-containing protein [Rhabdobacter roseus]MBB5286617.1 uncharacterized membrane protein YcaP (DUF421 family) [Rhabdobacter roseus]